MKELTLDFAKWRSGLYSPNAVGIGKTLLLNEQGFQCCLGQFCSQLGVPDSVLLRAGTPANDLLYNYRNVLAESEVQLIIKKVIDTGDRVLTKVWNSPFSSNAMQINDDETTSPEEKLELLTELCKNNNIDLKIINGPAKTVAEDIEDFE